MAGEGGLLLGRRTYDGLMQSWANFDDNPFSAVLEERRKYVASRTLRDPLPWRNSTPLAGDATAAVTELKATAPENELVMLGSGELLRALLRTDLLDQLPLLIHPLVGHTAVRR